MSFMEVKLVMERIKGATPASPIAVFRCDLVGQLNAVFADTVKTKQMIAAKDQDLIGVFDKTMNLIVTARTLRENVLSDRPKLPLVYPPQLAEQVAIAE